MLVPVKPLQPRLAHFKRVVHFLIMIIIVIISSCNDPVKDKDVLYLFYI